MCKSLVEGGQRCAAHAHKKLMDAAKLVTHHAGLGDRDKYEQARTAWEQAAVEYASTPAGAVALEKQRAMAEETGDAHAAGMLSSILRRGSVLREANQQVKSTISLIVAMESLPAHEEEVDGAKPANDLNGNPFTAEEQAVWDEMMREFAARRAANIASTGHPDGHNAHPNMFDAVVALDKAVADPDTDDAALSRALAAALIHAGKERPTILAATQRRVLDHPQAGPTTWEKMSRLSDINDTLGHHAIHGAVITRITDRLLDGSLQDYTDSNAHWGAKNVQVGLADVTESTWDSLHSKGNQGDLHATLACLHSPTATHREDALMAISACDYDQMSVYEIGLVMSSTEKSRYCPEFSESMRATMRASIRRYAQDLDEHGSPETVQRRTSLLEILGYSDRREAQWMPPEKRTQPYISKGTRL